MLRATLPFLALLLAAAAARAGEPIRLASGPATSPDGERIVFSWTGDLWVTGVDGGAATRLTRHPGLDAFPAWSPDGTEIAFSGDRGHGRQVFVVPAAGGDPEPVTFDTDGFSVVQWYPDGEHLLVRGRSDHDWRDPWRFYRISTKERRAPEMLFDAYGGSASLSPDGRRTLFTREGVAWWRKGYRGSQASQIWLHDADTGEFRPVLREEGGCRWPLWLPDGKSFLYVGIEGGAMNLLRYDLESGERTALTSFPDDGVVAPAVSPDGAVVVFRHLFDLYRLRPGEDARPVRLAIENSGERVGREHERRLLKSAEAAAFTKDGLEVAFAAGGDLFVMDTVLREPVAVTETPEEESEPVFLPDSSVLLFVSGAGGQVDLRRAVRADADLYWWQSTGFRIEKITDDAAVESRLSVSPDGQRIAYVREPGTLVVADPDGGNPVVLLTAFNAPDYDWSPDSRWIAYAVDDDDFNRDVWIVPADGSAPAVNVSRHPDNEWNPAFSPDGKILAFVGRRADRETDVHYVWLRLEDDERTSRDRTVEEALEKMKKGRKPETPKKEEPKAEGPKKTAAEPKGPAPVEIDFEDIAERVRTISIPDSEEGALFWSPDGKRLAFTATVGGKRGVYAVEFPDELKPKLLTGTVGSGARWVAGGKQIRWLVRGVPTVTTPPSKSESYGFSARQEVDIPARYAAAFDEAWRIMRDRFYDPAMNRRNWDEIRRKYRDAAATAPDRATLDRVVDLMLGELNGSHLGFSTRPEPAAGPKDDWNEETGHLGVRLDDAYAGPGLLVAHVFGRGPADRAGIVAGETILTVDGEPVDPGLDPSVYLNGAPGREVRLTVRGSEEGAEPREVRLVPTNLSGALRLAYDDWLRSARAAVEAESGGRLGYVHIRGMNWPSFLEFEREIYDVGYGKDGLVIDVRENGGGFTTDHLLTILTQPRHAFTVQRGGGPGYPQDRRVYATWSKPIVVLANQNSFSNAEIFAHAIQTLGRGRLVGVPTAGGVISTGGARVLDIGYLRTPGRGWFTLPDGEDMELNGAVPDVIVWPEPGELPAGVDRQLDKAVELLLEDVEALDAEPKPKPRYASERPGREPR